MIDIKTKMMTENVKSREEIESKQDKDKKLKQDILAQTLFGKSKDGDSVFNPNRG
jgi:hypothetical protein